MEEQMMCTTNIEDKVVDRPVCFHMSEETPGGVLPLSTTLAKIK
jgi:hypothetical protein